MMDYATLRVIWWVLIGVIVIGFALLDGFDFGALALLPFVATNNAQKRVLLNVLGPVWEGNQAWFILAGGAMFAAWPYLYAVTFSGLYLPMFVLLITFILRPVGIKYRSKLLHRGWRICWDTTLCVSATISIFLFGWILGNVFQGLPFYFDPDLRVFYSKSLVSGGWNSFSILCGLLSLGLLYLHGACYLTIKTEGPLQQRAIHTARLMPWAIIFLLGIISLLVTFKVKGYHLAGVLAHDGVSNPLHKQVIAGPGFWTHQFTDYPWGRVLPIIGFAGTVLTFFLIKYYAKLAFISSSLSITSILVTLGFLMFPFLLPSSTAPNASLVVWDASASRSSLLYMLIFVIIFFPIILGYTTWVYRVLRGKVTEKAVAKNTDHSY